jgi:hypothetical protein
VTLASSAYLVVIKLKSLVLMDQILYSKDLDMVAYTWLTSMIVRHN